MYFKEGKLDKSRVLVPIIRMVLSSIGVSAVFGTFYFASLSGVNGGIISTIFASAVIFSPFMFYLKYG